MAKNTQKDPKEKLELAQRIANNSQKVVRTYATLENAVLSFFRRLFGYLNKIIFDSKFSKVAALIIAVIIYISVNAGNSKNVSATQASQINDIPIKIIYNSEIYEISGIPKTADVIVMGDMSDITLQKSQINSTLTADLSGLTEGTYTIKLSPTNFISRLSVNVIDIPTVSVTIKKKTTTRFGISSEYINTNAMENIYSLSSPIFETTEVMVRASQDTIDQIAMVKALIDVTGVTGSFSQQARVVAYNHQGQMIDCDIIPETVNVQVTVTSPNKEVPILIKTSGTMAEGLAISKISLDFSTVTVYAPTNVLDLLDAVYIDLDVTDITKNTVYSKALTMPSGVRSMSVTKVNMDITVGEIASRTIEQIPVQYINNADIYKFAPLDAADAYVDVEVIGTADNINSIVASDISVDMDLKDITLGIQSVPLIIRGSNNFVTYRIADGRTSIEIQVTEKG